MRFLADENFPGPIVESLRHEGHDVFWAREQSPGAKDRTLLSQAREEGRILLTFDKDFGELAFRSNPSPPGGIILFRVSAPSPQRLLDHIQAALNQKIEWMGHFAVVEDDRIRLNPLLKRDLTRRKKPESGPPQLHEPPAAYRVRKPKPKPGKRGRKPKKLRNNDKRG